MPRKFPDFNLSSKTKELCDKLLTTTCFSTQKQIEIEAMDLLVYAHSTFGSGRTIAGIRPKKPSVQEVRLNFMSKMKDLGQIGTTPFNPDVIKEFRKDPKAYIDKLVASGAFTSFDDFAEQSLCLIGWGWAELSRDIDTVIGSVSSDGKTYAGWTFPLRKRMKAKAVS